VPTICLTNDDGPYSLGMIKLAQQLRKISDLVVIVPEGQRSATGKSLTLNRPLRVNERNGEWGYRLITHDGTPADSVVLAAGILEKIDLLVSGINAGGNLGYQSMFTSGTVGAVYEASLKGYPALAVSMESGPNDWFNPNGSEKNYETAVEITAGVVRRILENGLPAGFDALNLNFPCTVTADTELVVTRPARVRMTNRMDHRIDPHGRDYYWIEGIEQTCNPGTDVFATLTEGKASIAPIIIDTVTEKDLSLLRDFLEL
jgi:5'-nucleotidase